jgi:hypothetical protein
MHTLRISDRDAQAYNLRTEQEISFPDLLGSISRVYAKQPLLECNAIAEKNGLLAMSLDGINAEIQAVRSTEYFVS